MKLSPKQYGAIFEKLHKEGRLKPTVPHVPSTGTKIPQALTPPTLPGSPPLPDEVNQNLVGNPRHQRFQRMKKILGL